MAKAIVWRESVYYSRCCPNCGTRLMTPDDMPTNIHTSFFGKKVYCEKCGLFVARFVTYNGPKTGRGGKWEGRL